MVSHVNSFPPVTPPFPISLIPVLCASALYLTREGVTCADELIRQVTVNCAERGLLLLRVRDEIRITIAAYQTLYESSVAFGMRKALASEQGKSDLERKVRPLTQLGGLFNNSHTLIKCAANVLEHFTC